MIAEDQQLAVSACFEASSRECDEIAQAVFGKIEAGRNRFRDRVVRMPGKAGRPSEYLGFGDR